MTWTAVSSASGCATRDAGPCCFFKAKWYPNFYDGKLSALASFLNKELLMTASVLRCEGCSAQNNPLCIFDVQPPASIRPHVCTVLHKTRVYCTVLYCTVLYCTPLYNIVVVPSLRSLNHRKKYILGVRQERKSKIISCHLSF